MSDDEHEIICCEVCNEDHASRQIGEDVFVCSKDCARTYYVSSSIAAVANEIINSRTGTRV